VRLRVKRWTIIPTKILLLATDSSEDAQLTAKAAADLSKRMGAQLHVSRVWRPLPHYTYPGFASEEYHSPYEEGARKLLAEQMERIETAAGVVAEAHLVAGQPADATIDLVEKVGVDTVMGSRGLGPVRRLVMGGVSEEIIHCANRPVLGRAKRRKDVAAETGGRR
jgi:nucleotide-binding universal stress UspA family protein